MAFVSAASTSPLCSTFLLSSWGETYWNTYKQLMGQKGSHNQNPQHQRESKSRPVESIDGASSHLGSDSSKTTPAISWFSAIRLVHLFGGIFYGAFKNLMWFWKEVTGSTTWGHTWFQAVATLLGVCGTLVLLGNSARADAVDGCNAFERHCSVHESSRDDHILDALDVYEGLHEGTFDGSGAGLEQVCYTAFYDALLNDLNLQKNSLHSLPNDVFDHTRGFLNRVRLGENSFTKFPPALNSSSHIQFLNLSHNQITHIDCGTINGMTNLTFIDLSGNDMTQAPEDIFHFVNQPRLKVIMRMMQVQHPLVPPPGSIVCSNDTPCIVTHTVEGVLVIVNGNKVTVELTWNGTCEEVKKKLEASYEVLNGSLDCWNNILNGTVKIVRKVKSDTEWDLSKSTTPTVQTKHHSNPAPPGGGGFATAVIVVVGIIVVLVFVVMIVACVCAKKGKLCNDFQKIPPQCNGSVVESGPGSSESNDHTAV